MASGIANKPTRPRVRLFDGCKVKREAEPDQRRQKHQEPLPLERQPGQHQIAQDSYCSNRYVRDLGKRAVVHDTAVPLFVDGAGLGSGGIMHVQRQDGDRRRPEPATLSNSEQSSLVLV